MTGPASYTFSLDIWRAPGPQRFTVADAVPDFESVCAAAQVMSRPPFHVQFTAVRRNDGIVVIAYRDGSPAPLDDYLLYEPDMTPGALYKTVAVIWSRDDGAQAELSSLALGAETGSAYCSAQRSMLVADPSQDPDWDGTEFFGDAAQPGRRLVTLYSDRLRDGDLDDDVHDVAGRIGSGINNDGIAAQIGFLIEQLGEARAEGLIASALRRGEEP